MTRKAKTKVLEGSQGQKRLGSHTLKSDEDWHYNMCEIDRGSAEVEENGTS